MSNRITILVEFLREVYDRVLENRLPFLAGSLAFHSFVALLPILLLLLMAASRIGGHVFVEAIIKLTREYLSPSGQSLLAHALADGSGQLQSSILSVLILSWSSYRIVWGLRIVFIEVYEGSIHASISHRILDICVGIVALLLAIIAILGSGVIFSLVPSLRTTRVFASLVMFGGLFVAFFLIYYVFPHHEVTVVDVLPGTLVAAVSWTVLQVLFNVYTDTISVYDAYGVIGSVMLLLVWLYLGALILLIGIVLNTTPIARSKKEQTIGAYLKARLSE